MTVLKPGLLTTVQDAGRPGYRAFGLPVAGAMDRLSYALANLLAGNAPGAAALEMTLLGGAFRFSREGYAAVCGADMQASLDGRPLGPASGFPVAAGSELAFGGARVGVRTYLAVRGGLDVPLVLGSRSTYSRAGIGGFEGRALRVGDALPLGRPRGTRPPPRSLAPGLAPEVGGEVRLRCIPGPQDDLFTTIGRAMFFGAEYRVTNRNDRMGYQLEGPSIQHAGGADIVSDALVPGAVQVPGSATPIVMTVDAQTTGGYAKIATVIGSDLRRLAQARAGDVVRFESCTLDDAVEALRLEKGHLDEVRALLEGASRPAARGARRRTA
ncbi:MAG TPA: biotin-dependent carboxyltransferase family protein [Anaeromyxobacteraceae bacterium]|nr:biotin-dependent carboxyltransferase family protein [Anaeromyxobacteraceae bacterium]